MPGRLKSESTDHSGQIKIVINGFRYMGHAHSSVRHLLHAKCRIGRVVAADCNQLIYI